MAAEPLHALVLVGLGVRELSMTPVAIPRVKNAVRSVKECGLRAAAAACMTAGTAEEAERLLTHELVGALSPGDEAWLGVMEAKE
jgi:phosphoenolpyruvate-protein kinase (PTS system EI component)